MSRQTQQLDNKTSSNGVVPIFNRNKMKCFGPNLIFPFFPVKIMPGLGGTDSLPVSIGIVLTL